MRMMNSNMIYQYIVFLSLLAWRTMQFVTSTDAGIHHNLSMDHDLPEKDWLYNDNMTEVNNITNISNDRQLIDYYPNTTFAIHRMFQGDCDEAGLKFSHESRLINCLLDRYEHVTTLARPVSDSGSNVIVDFGISLIQILDFDEINQVLTTSIWKNYVWEDEVLRWDPAKFGGVTQIRLPATHIWTPDIVLYNNADEQIKQHEELVAVYYNGTIKWIPPAIYRSSCEIDMKDFPFDRQECFFKFGSWTYDQHKVDVQLFEGRSKIDLREYIQSSEWEILNTSAQRRIRQYPFFDTDPYPEVIFHMTLKRQSTFYIYLLVLPCILLSALTLVLFWIPPQRPDRTAVGMSLFSSFFILLLILVQSSPPTSASISRLGINYCVNMVLIALSTIISVAIINIGQPGARGQPPKWLTQSRLSSVASLCCVRQRSGTHNGKENHEDGTENGVFLEHFNVPGERATLDEVRHWEHHRTTARRWNTLASILDRIFFFVYLIAIIVSTVFIFPRY